MVHLVRATALGPAAQPAGLAPAGGQRLCLIWSNPIQALELHSPSKSAATRPLAVSAPRLSAQTTNCGLLQTCVQHTVFIIG